VLIVGNRSMLHSEFEKGREDFRESLDDLVKEAKVKGVWEFQTIVPPIRDRYLRAEKRAIARCLVKTPLSRVFFGRSMSPWGPISTHTDRHTASAGHAGSSAPLQNLST